MRILLTGGAGYIGSHVAVELAAAGHEIMIADNLSNSKIDAVRAIEKIVGKRVEFHKIDIRDEKKLSEVFEKGEIDAVIHLAGLKAVGESVEKPLLYYENNLNSTMTLLKVMGEFKCWNLVFSSSATVYGEPDKLPLDEESRVGLGITNPYGRTKYMIEEILKDMAISDKRWNITLLRYFNPVGAHESGMIGEDPNGIPNNLMPYVAKVATGELEQVGVFGDDYETRDGTGVRDYIHVVDLAQGHVAALKNTDLGIKIYNLSTGNGTTVLELIEEYKKASGVEIRYEIVERRAGDVAAMFADASKALDELGWKAEKNIFDASRDDWKFRTKKQP